MSGTRSRPRDRAFHSIVAVLGAIAGLVLLASCSPEPPDGFAPSPAASDGAIAGASGAPGCDPPSPSRSHEVRGTADDGRTDVHGMFQDAEPGQLVADSAVRKFLVRMSGSGDLSAMLQSPDGNDVPLAWGPEEHLSSTYNRPGDEWGTGLVFDAAGCWGLLLSRSEEGKASFWFDVGHASPTQD